jgi:glycosyltransferase involved in cell wall biosynthesis
MPQSDVFVLPTNAEGSFAFTVFEALAHGLPVISVDAWALPEIIDEGSTGYLIAPNSLDDLVQCMLRLAEDSELRGRMARNCLRVFSERFSIEAHNRQLLEVYQDALDESVLGQQRRMLGAAHASRSEVTHDG